MSALFGKLCRTCLGTPESLYSFQIKCVDGSAADSNASGRSIGYMLRTLAPSLGVELGPDLPEQVCELCLNEVVRTRAFLQKWHKSESALRNMLNTARGTATLQEKSEPNFHITAMDGQEEVIIMHAEPGISDEEEEDIVIEEDDHTLEWTDAVTEIEEEVGAVEMPVRVKYEVDLEDKPETEEEIVETNMPEEEEVDDTVKDEDDLVDEQHRPPVNSTALPLHCPDCNTTFIRKKSLEKHRAKYHPTTTMESNTDSSSSQIIDTRAEAVSEPKEGKAEFKCNVCLATFGHRKSLNNHMKFKRCYSETPSFRCTVCNRTFVRKNALLLHMETHEKIINPESVELICTICPVEKRESFLYLGALTEHMRKHRNVSMKHTCDECGKSFSMYSSLKDHIRTHSGEKPFVCSVCGKGFSQSTNMKQHMMRHNKEKPYKCDVCDYSFVSKGELEAHKRKHSGEHPFVCDDCGHGFTTSSSLVKHKRTHTGARPYPCSYCEQSFSVLGTLKNHERTHTGERPYTCGVCSKSFTQKTDLVVHTRIHTGERPYKCQICALTFHQSASLKNHQKSHTVEQVQDIESGDTYDIMQVEEQVIEVEPSE